MKAVFLLALICAVAYANDEEHQAEHPQEQQEAHHHHHHHHHGHHNHSVCELSDEHLGHVLTCVGRKVDEQVNAKLNEISVGLGCDTILCGIKKVCERNGGTLEGHHGNQTSILSDDDNAALRTAFLECRPRDAAHAHLGDVPATEASPEA